MDKSQLDLYLSDHEARKAALKEYFLEESSDGKRITEEMQNSIISRLCFDVFDCGIITQEDIELNHTSLSPTPSAPDHDFNQNITSPQSPYAFEAQQAPNFPSDNNDEFNDQAYPSVPNFIFQDVLDPNNQLNPNNFDQLNTLKQIPLPPHKINNLSLFKCKKSLLYN